MPAILLCLFSFGVCYFFARRSLAQGIIALLAVGYFYGIVRANLISTFSHFTFDAGLIALYAARLWDRSQSTDSTLRLWVVLLIAWPALICLMPFQPLMVSIVGLRGNIFFLPMILLGSRLRESDLIQIAWGLVVLNLVALGFAGGEYFTSVQQFYPYSAVTQIIYASGDAGGGFFRIPAIFSSAAAFGSSMVLSLPFLTGAWMRAKTGTDQIKIGVGLGAALLGILLSATRMNFVLGCAAVITIFFGARMKIVVRTAFILLIFALTYSAMTNIRFQRFKSLGDTEGVSDRIAGSVNRSFWELLSEYPMGNGLGGGGTSIPYFLEGQVRNPIGLESDYSRILCEQGVVGLLLWISFIMWILSRTPRALMNRSPWQGARRLAVCLSLFQFVTGLIGLGMLTAIPGTAVFLLNLGWAIAPARMTANADAESPVSSGAAVPQRLGHAY